MQWQKDAKAMFNHKCAECHEGDMFPTGSFSFKEPFEMHERCPKCDANYYPEPGFYYGAMFISYIFTAFFFLGFVMLLHWVFDLSLMTSFIWLLLFVATFFVWWFRFARAFWLNLLVGFRPEKATVAKAKG
ncbi:DUF983 domain-containing protein [Neolewinella persica]|uniref:DUF983 domain-containing protein n=1 Tax=Neolewinella persica TaxID=70998 RepID=UPI00037580C0|nr:DUF983 domain-containing protein [Neolewinella persica]